MPSLKNAIYSINQIRKIEQLAQDEYHITEQNLMQKAANAAFDFMVHHFPLARKIAVCCGNGNNGNDGYLLAIQAKKQGMEVIIWHVGSLDRAVVSPGLAAAHALNIPVEMLSAHSDLGHPDLIIDAICGIGVTTPLREEHAKAVAKINQHPAPVFALDVPSGIHPETGGVLGIAIMAEATITFLGLKLGLLTGPGLAASGEVFVSDLDLPATLWEKLEPQVEMITFIDYQQYLKPRLRDWHKGLSGHTLVIGGAKGMSGAVLMAALAAMRVGSGLLTIATHPDHAYFIGINHPELMIHGVDSALELKPLLAKADSIILGPGLSHSAWGRVLWQEALSAKVPLVLDADGLNLLAEVGGARDKWVLTPHPGEAATLLQMSTQEIQQDRLKAVQALQEKFGGVVVLKGAGTLVKGPLTPVFVCDKGNPGMASAGMGDVLSGVIGGLIAQGIPLDKAAILGTFLHAKAGDLNAKASGERGMMATDLMPYLRLLVNPRL